MQVEGWRRAKAYCLSLCLIQWAVLGSSNAVGSSSNKSCGGIEQCLGEPLPSWPADNLSGGAVSYSWIMQVLAAIGDAIGNIGAAIKASVDGKVTGVASVDPHRGSEEKN